MSTSALFLSLFISTLSVVVVTVDKAEPDQELQCEIRLLAYEYALMIQEFRGIQPNTFDALQIDDNCNKEIYNKYKPNSNQQHQYYHSNKPIIDNDNMLTVYVDPINGNNSINNGSKSSPFQTILRALNETRKQKSNDLIKQIVIREGISYLTSSINLSAVTFDNNLLIRGYPNENVWISGGLLLNVTQFNWKRYNDGNSSHNIWTTSLNNSNQKHLLFNNTILSLFTEIPHKRLTRSRYPNGELSVFYAGNQWLNPSKTIIEWWTAYGETPKQIFKNLTCTSSGNEPCLNYSYQSEYSTYTAGYGGLCDLWDESYSYWCGSNVAGGWAFMDQRMALNGTRQIPIGVTYNKTEFTRINNWKSNFSEAVVLMRHQQKWNVYMFSIGEYDQSAGDISFASGGWQGGRVLDAPSGGEPISSGGFYFSGILDELDVPGEWYYDSINELLYYWPNNTKTGQPPNETNINLIIGNLATLFRLSSNNHSNPLFNVTISDISFRDTRYTYMDKWGVPSGGDWALYNGGAIVLENTTNCTIENSAFVRLDGNVILLRGYNRNTTLYRNEFELIGDNVMAGWGYTNHYDGTDDLQPAYTYIIENYVHDIGLYQQQSSLWFQAKSYKSFIIRNIGFNLPRAAILFNDAFGGGNECTQNLLFNTCTETGDHGPINSWNRMPFFTNIAYGYPSFDSLYSNIYSNFIIANYHGSQSFDTDDGSAFYKIYNNFFYEAMALKNDFGGYSMFYYGNINVVWKKGGTSSCWNIGPTIYNGYSDTIYNNKCIVYDSDVISTINSPTSYNGSSFVSYYNEYYTPNGNASFQMQNVSGSMVIYNVSQLQNLFHIELNSTSNILPNDNDIILWVRNVLNM